jgi:hypothetical protein
MNEEIFCSYVLESRVHAIINNATDKGPSVSH